MDLIMNNNFIPEEEYLKIVKSIPIFCVDFLIRCGNKNLLLKRTQEPLKDTYWVIGGRMNMRETMDDLAIRIQQREIGRYINNRKLIGFSNYLHPEVENPRSTHTPTLLYLVKTEEMFEPNTDDTHSDYIWTEKLPDQMIEQTEFIELF
jgi:colanic acid biosynthesis protein WcaH